MALTETILWSHHGLLLAESLVPNATSRYIVASAHPPLSAHSLSLASERDYSTVWANPLPSSSLLLIILDSTFGLSLLSHSKTQLGNYLLHPVSGDQSQKFVYSALKLLKPDLHCLLLGIYIGTQCGIFRDLKQSMTKTTFIIFPLFSSYIPYFH